MNAREIGPELLERWALGYLGRYASSAENLRRVLMRRARRYSSENAQQAGVLIEALIVRYQESGLLDDAAYAAARVESLRRRGDSLKAIRARLAAKGVSGELALPIYRSPAKRSEPAPAGEGAGRRYIWVSDAVANIGDGIGCDLG